MYSSPSTKRLMLIYCRQKLNNLYSCNFSFLYYFNRAIPPGAKRLNSPLSASDKPGVAEADTDKNGRQASLLHPATGRPQGEERLNGTKVNPQIGRRAIVVSAC